MEQQWVSAVRLEQAGTVLHVVLQCTGTTAAAAAASNCSQEATYHLCVLDAHGVRAWSSSFSRDDVEEALRQDLTDLGPEMDSALAQSIQPSKISLHWSGPAAASQLYLKAQYDRQDFVPATFRLPPFGEMPLQQGDAFSAINACVLDVLIQQSRTLQQTASLLQVKLQELASHAQHVHDSYCDAVYSMAAQPGHDYTPGSILDRTAAAAAAAAEPASKRQRVDDLVLPSLSPGGITLATASRLDSDAVAGLQLPFSQDDAPALAATAAAAGNNGGPGRSKPDSTSKPVTTSSKKGKPKQLSSHERMLQRVASGHRRLQQDWNGWLKQLLEAQDVLEVQKAVAGRSGQQQQQHQLRGGLVAAGSSQMPQQQQQQQGLKTGSQHQQHQQQQDHRTPGATTDATGAAASAEVSADEDAEPFDEEDEIRLVHKPRAKKQAGGPIFGTPKGKQRSRTREGSGGRAGA